LKKLQKNKFSNCSKGQTLCDVNFAAPQRIEILKNPEVSLYIDGKLQRNSDVMVGVCGHCCDCSDELRVE
jgi:hypothetical protein